MIKVYIYGCLTCGTRRTATNNVRRYADLHGHTMSVIDTKASESDQTDHMNYLIASGLPTDKYDAIVIIDDHNPTEITPLIDWL